MFPRIPSPLVGAALLLALGLGAGAVPPAAAAAVTAAAVTAAPAAAPAAAAPAAAPVAAAPAADTPQWSVAPADADGPDGRISLRHTIDPGGSAVDAIAVTNLGAEAAEYVVAPGDGVIGDDGAFDIAAGDPQSAGAWISIDGPDAGILRVAPGETRVLPVRIDVPIDVTPGDHPAGIVVGVSRSDGGVTVTNRIGVRVHLQVAGEIVPALETIEVTSTFRPSWIPFAPGVLRVETRVGNSGNVRLGALTSVSGVGVDSASSGAEPVELLPGDTAPVVVETSAWPLFVLFGEAEVRAVALGEDAVTVPASSATGIVTPAVSWSGLAVLVLVAGGIVVGVVARRRRRAPAIESTPNTEETESRVRVDVR